MRRLLKKSNLTLSHATTLESFINICRDGAIKPFNLVSNGRRSNSLDANSIYLTKSSGWEFARDFMQDDKYLTSVCLNVNVEENNLLPSYDIFEYEAIDVEKDENTGQKYIDVNGSKKEVDDLTWEDTIILSDECKYKGEIPLNSITEVIFFTQNNKMKNLLPSDRISIEEAKEIIEKLF